MFESESLEMSEQLTGLREELFPDAVKTLVASNIFVACEMSKQIAYGAEMINLPRRATWLAGHSLPFFIERLMTKAIDQSMVGKFPFNYREEKVPRGAFTYVEYYCSLGKFHIKKVPKEGKLPPASYHRVSNALANKLALDFGPNYIPQGVHVPFSIITYGHTKFNLEFIGLGFPKYDYSGWADNVAISDSVSKETVETIRKENAPALKEEFQEKIEKNFDLKLKGD